MSCQSRADAQHQAHQRQMEDWHRERSIIERKVCIGYCATILVGADAVQLAEELARGKQRAEVRPEYVAEKVFIPGGAST